MYTIAHLSDPHLDGGEAARRGFRRVVDYLRGLATPVDRVVLSLFAKCCRASEKLSNNSAFVRRNTV